MTKLKKIAGFDVSKKFFDVSVFCDGRHSVRQFLYDDQGLKLLLKWLPEDAHCVMEATGPYYLKLAVALHQGGRKVSVVNPLSVKRFSQMRLIRTKTDKADAKMIAAYGLSEEPVGWEPPEQYVITLQHLQALNHQLLKQRTALLCQREAMEASGMTDLQTLKMLGKLIVQLEKEIQVIETRCEKIMEEQHGKMLARLSAIPGIGKKTAIALLLLSGGFKKFSNHKQLSAYIGLCPRIYESGTSVKGKARICKMGMSRIRAMLYLCTWSAKKCNKACKELYDRLVDKGKSKRLALIAVANKLIKQAFAIATKNTEYDNNYSKISCF